MSVQRLRDGLWRKRLAAIERVWAAARDGDPAGVHQLRVASRRVREALPVVSDGQHPRRVKRMRRKVRSLTRTLGPVRERDVSLALLAELDKEHPAARSAIGLVRRRIMAERKEFRRDLEKHLGGLAPEDLIRKLARAAKGRKKVDDQEERRWRLLLLARIARRARQLKEAIEEAGALYAPDRLHAVRVTTKKFRYAFEVAREAKAGRWDAATRFLKDTQDILGQLQDRESLLVRVRTVQGLESSPTLSGAFDQLTRLLEEDARQYHARFVSRRERLLKLCTVTRQQVSQVLPIGRPAPKRIAAASRPHAARSASGRQTSKA